MSPQARDPQEAQASLACWPGLTHIDAAERAMAGACEPNVGRLAVRHVQIVPQSMGVFDEPLAEFFRDRWPNTTFRLHANVCVLRSRCIVDLAAFESHPRWFSQAARIHRILGADAYSAHPGRRRDASLHEVLGFARRSAELFGYLVAIEGQYPVAGEEPRQLLVSSWQEYRELFESGVPYAIDLSHVNILAHRSGVCERGLLQEMLASERCLEVHLSHNDGTGDWHQQLPSLRGDLWWWDLLRHVHPGTVVFSEGNQLRRRKPAPPLGEMNP